MKDQEGMAGRPLGALLALIYLFLIAPQAANASTYQVLQCHQSQRSVETALEGPASGYNMINSCAGATPAHLQAGTSAAVVQGQHRQFAISVPTGTRMDNVTGYYAQQGHSNPEGHVAYMFVRRVGGGQELVSQTSGAGGFTDNFDLNAAGYGPIDRIGVGVICTRSLAQGKCPQKSGLYHRMGELRLYMRDLVAPDQPQTSGTILNGWVNGSEGFTINGSDTGAGVSATSTWANGQLIDVAIPCSPDAERLRPCPATGSDSGTYNVAAAPSRRGTTTCGAASVSTATTPR